MRISLSKKIMVFPFLLIGIGFLGCKDADKESIAQAQLCLDKVTQTDTAAVQACLDKLGNVDTQEANIVRCSGEILLGGLTTEKVVNAFSQSSGSQAALMVTLAVTNQGSGSTDTANKTLALKTETTCKKSNVSGLIALASFSKIGTVMVVGSGLSCADPLNCTPAEASTIVTNCSSNCSPEEVGNTAIIVADSYCTGDNVNSPECKEIQTAIQNGNSDPTTIGQYLIDHLNN